jgi:hypothetical protein
VAATSSLASATYEAVASCTDPGTAQVQSDPGAAPDTAPGCEGIIVAHALMSNISGEATNRLGNIFAEATRQSGLRSPRGRLLRFDLIAFSGRRCQPAQLRLPGSGASSGAGSKQSRWSSASVRAGASNVAVFRLDNAGGSSDT